MKFCEKNEIHVTAYSSLGTTLTANGQSSQLINDENVSKIAKLKNLSNAQVLLLWALQKGLSVVPKSVSEGHIKENIDLKTSLDDCDMKALDELEIGKKTEERQKRRRECKR